MKPRIEKKEFSDRIKKIQEEMRKAGFGGLMVYGDEYRRENLRYACNFWPIFERAAVFIGLKNEPVLVSAPEGEKYAREMSVWEDLRNIKEFCCVSVPEEIDYPFARFSGLKEILGQILKGGKKLGIVGGYDIPAFIMERIKNACSAEIKSADCIFQKMRLTKSAAEIECLKEAGRLACVAYKALLKNAIPGNTELKATGAAEGAARMAGAESIVFTVFGSGSRADTVIGRPTEKIIRDGDMVMASIAVQYQGYISTAEFPFVAGKASKKQRELIKILLEASMIGGKLIKAGEPMKNMVRAVRDHFRRNKMGLYDIYPPLHGCGLAEAESPYPDEKTGQLFEAGMAVNTDISLFGHSAGSNRIEEGFIIKKTRLESITPFIHELILKEA